MHILRSMFVISGSSLYPGFIVERFDCTVFMLCSPLHSHTMQCTVLDSTHSVVYLFLLLQQLCYVALFILSSQGSWEIHNDSVLVHVGQECLNSVFSASIPFVSEVFCE